jgi:mono/diheme cytochrome c family protein
MNKNLIVAGIVALAAVLGLAFYQTPTPAPQPGSVFVDVGDPVLGEVLYREGCAVCHGVNLEGQPNWQTPGEDGRLPAPPHDKSGHTWHHADEMLFNYTKIGGQEALNQMGVKFDSGMPGFGDQLSDQQIWDILAYIKSTWPERERQAQEQRNEDERLNQEEN